MRKYSGFIFAAATMLAACSGAEQSVDQDAPTQPQTTTTQPDTPQSILVTEGVNSGTYNLEKTHASLIWKVSHNGLSNYTARFTDFDAQIMLDAGAPAAASLTARINPLSVRTDHPSGPDWDQTLRSDEKWFNAENFSEITYRSTSIDMTGDKTGIVNGELSLLGITQQVPLAVSFNGVRNFAWYGERDVIGFSATATLKRSDFGITALLPAIGDEVKIIIEAEFVEAE